MIAALTICATHSRWLLILGLLAGIGLPGFAALLAPWLPQMVAGLLVVSAFRIGHRAAFGAFSDLAWSIPTVLVLQLFLPLVFFAVFAAVGLADTPWAFAVVLACAAPTISGGASLAIILRQDPARMMQLLVLGTALFPATILVVLTLMPTTISSGALIQSALWAMLVILGSSGVGFGLRHLLLKHPTPEQTTAMDGATVLFFAVIVIGLMSALGPILRSDPGLALRWVCAAFALSFGLQMLTVLVLQSGTLRRVSGPVALAAGNRNIALFLVSLPADIMAPIMIFVACWQLPMYLTPILLPKLYARVPAHD